MLEQPTRRLDLRELLQAVEQASPVGAAAALAEVLGRAFGVTGVAFLIADFSANAVIRLSEERSGAGQEERVLLDGTPHGRALAAQEIVTEHDDATGSWRLYAPVTNRGEAIGVLELALGQEPDAAQLEDVEVAAHALAYVVIANRRFTDLFEWGQRTVPLSLAAEIQHRLLPATSTCEGGQFTLAAWMEPAGEIAGDTYDFSLERDVLHLSMTDAMGHAVGAAVLATVLVGALRNGRRAGRDLVEQAVAAGAALAEHLPGEGFVTGQLVRVDLPSGTARIVNAGHPPPLRLRDGRVEPVALEADLPFGAAPAPTYREQVLELRPGDRLVFLTDGFLERNAADVPVADLIARGGGEHPRQAVQMLVGAILEACDGELSDDATVLCLDWHGGVQNARDSTHGADR